MQEWGLLAFPHGLLRPALGHLLRDSTLHDDLGSPSHIYYQSEKYPTALLTGQQISSFQMTVACVKLTKTNK